MLIYVIHNNKKNYSYGSYLDRVYKNIEIENKPLEFIRDISLFNHFSDLFVPPSNTKFLDVSYWKKIRLKIRVSE